MSGEEEEVPTVPALQAWAERPDTTSLKNDMPRIHVWWPRSVPHAVLQTLTTPDRSEYLPHPSQPMVNLHIGAIEFGGPLEDIEALIDAARDSLRLARHYADSLAVTAGDAS